MSRTSLWSRSSRAAVGVGLLLATGLLAGCTGDEPDEGAPSAPPSASASGGPVVIDGEEMTPVVEMTVPVPGHEEDEVTLGLVSLTAEGTTTQMRLLMTPHFAPDEGESAADVDDVSVHGMFGGTTLPKLVDVGAVTTYDVVGRADGDLETDVVRAQTPNDVPILYQAWFPRPENDPDALDVWLHASWPTIEDVPVTYVD